MRELYQEAGLNSRQIAVVLGMPERTVRARLQRYGVKTRTRGGWNREDRTMVPASALLLLYSELGMTAAEAGRRLGLSADKVLRAAQALPIWLAIKSGASPKMCSRARRRPSSPGSLRRMAPAISSVWPGSSAVV